MTFHRSPAGLSNLHLFVKVDFVVFVEGGNSFSVEEIIGGCYSPDSVDLKFWQDVFRLFLHERAKFQFRAIGAKPTLNSIANLISHQRISNVWVAMDRDHDSFHDKLWRAPGILYTYGYSWENDVCSTDVIEEVFWSLAQISRKSVQVRDQIENLFSNACHQLQRVVYLDVLISFYGGSLLPRDKPDSVWVLSKRGEPSINRAHLASLINRLRKTYPRPIYRPKAIDIRVARDCVGHVLACFYYRTLRFLTKQYTNLGTIQTQIINNLMIEKFITHLTAYQTSEVFVHYKKQFSLLDEKISQPAPSIRAASRWNLFLSRLQRWLKSTF